MRACVFRCPARKSLQTTSWGERQPPLDLLNARSPRKRSGTGLAKVSRLLHVVLYSGTSGRREATRRVGSCCDRASPNLASFGPVRPKLCRHRPSLVGLGPALTCIGRCWPESSPVWAYVGPDFATFGLDSAKLGARSAEFGPKSSNITRL